MTIIVWPPEGCAFVIVRARAHLVDAASPSPSAPAPEGPSPREARAFNRLRTQERAVHSRCGLTLARSRVTFLPRAEGVPVCTACSLHA
jgi:hypothetical protein